MSISLMINDTEHLFMCKFFFFFFNVYSSCFGFFQTLGFFFSDIELYEFLAYGGYY